MDDQSQTIEAESVSATLGHVSPQYARACEGDASESNGTGVKIVDASEINDLPMQNHGETNGVGDQIPESIPAPRGFTKEAIADWEQTPQTVRENTTRRIAELLSGIEGHREKVRAFEPLKPFHEMAVASGTTLPDALATFVGIDRLLKANAVAGTLQVWNNLGVNPVAISMHILQQFGAVPVQQQPAPQPAPDPRPDMRQTALEKARLSVTGSPSSNGPVYRQPSNSPRQALDRAFAQVEGR